MESFFYVLNILLLLSGLFTLCIKTGEKRYSLALIQALVALPLLSGEYVYLANHLELETTHLVLFSEIVFGVIWFSLVMHLHRTATETNYKSNLYPVLETIFVSVVILAAAFTLRYTYPAIISIQSFSFSSYGLAYFSAFAMLIVALYGSWRLEQFWRRLSAARRWEYKFFIVGTLLICGVLAWSSSYRLTYLTVFSKHLNLLAILLLLGWAMILYATVHHRLLNRKIFVSRKVVYSAVIPSLLAMYLMGFGLILLIMQTFGLEMSFVVQWTAVIFGVVAAGLFAFSGKIRRKVQFYISTHFYINKYEYRDEWLALSQELQGASNEVEVVNSLRKVLSESLYTTEIFIWLGGAASSETYTLVGEGKNSKGVLANSLLPADDPLAKYLEQHAYFHMEEKEPESDWHDVREDKKQFIDGLNISLFSSISIGDQLVGIIGLGPEYTGGKYSYDDFDLLVALGSQTASALLATRMAEELAHAREQKAWNKLSAFVLHDIKNASTMLALLQENAREHIHEPEFQQDMLELVDDSLKRMGRVEERLKTLKAEVSPKLEKVNLGDLLEERCRSLEAKIMGLSVNIEKPVKMEAMTDPELLCSVLENLLLNSVQASDEIAKVKIQVSRGDKEGNLLIELRDDGPGIPTDLLPGKLFEPFKTSKEGGNGIGLWQVKKVVGSLGGTISAENNIEGGACFSLSLPLIGTVGQVYR